MVFGFGTCSPPPPPVRGCGDSEAASGGLTGTRRRCRGRRGLAAVLALGLVSAGLLAVTAAPAAAEDRAAREALCSTGLDTTTDDYLKSAEYLTCLGRFAGGGVLSDAAHSYWNPLWENLAPNTPVHIRNHATDPVVIDATKGPGGKLDGAVSTYAYDDNGRLHVCNTWPSGWSDCP